MNSFDTKTTIAVGDTNYTIFNPSKISGAKSLPFSLKILLENLLRHEDKETVTQDHIEKFIHRDLSKPQEIAYHPARVLMQDFTGIPALVDLAAMRSAIQKSGGDPAKINPLQPVELVIDHSVQVDRFGELQALDLNTKIEFERNKERYKFLKWGQKAFSNFKVIPPGLGIVHQVNIEYLARVIFSDNKNGELTAYPDTLVGTDSHTTMVNGIGVLGWGVGGIEAEASMLGQAISMLSPSVVGFRLNNKLAEGATATDLVLTIVETLRKHGVVGKFVEFYGSGLDTLPPGDRCTIANMAPEYGASCGIFPIDQQTIDYLKLTGRTKQAIQLIETYAKETGLWRDDTSELIFDEHITLDLSTVVPCLAGPKRPQDRIQLSAIKETFQQDLRTLHPTPHSGKTKIGDKEYEITDGTVVIAAITSCTNTSNPSVMLAAGLVAQKATARGLTAKPWVKTSLAPGSRAVTDYLKKANLLSALQDIGFYIVGYGCTTCIGNSGPLPETIDQTIDENKIAVAAVLSGNRNFEGRIHPKVQMNYLASPPLVVAYAIAGHMNFNPYTDALTQDADGQDIYLRDIWPSHEEIRVAEKAALSPEQFTNSYAHIYDGDSNWQSLDVDETMIYNWNDSTYIAAPPYFEDLTTKKINAINNARILAFLGDSVTTDHISPAGPISIDSPAADYLQQHSVKPANFNSYGSRRGNHNVMLRGTFANIRLRNKLVPGIEGGYTLHFPDNKQMSIYDAAMHYQHDNIPTIILAGKEYGSGSSRDWAAKGPYLQGVKAVIAESYERIHRSNLVGMGILPLQFLDGDNAESLQLDGHEEINIENIEGGTSNAATIIARKLSGEIINFTTKIRIDTPKEIKYFQAGGILPYVLKQLSQS